MLQKRYAYLMGANGPDKQNIVPLKYAEKDIERLRKALSAYPCEFFKVDSIVARNPFEVLPGLEQLANQCEQSDLLIVHFAGHAYASGGHLYLICNETNVDRKLFTSTAISIDAIKEIFNLCRARHKLLILDCCHAATAHSGGTWRGDQELEYALEGLKGNANFILSACASNKRTRELNALEIDNEQGAGFLSWALANACNKEFATVSRDQALSLTDILSWLPKVLDETNKLLLKNEQIPPPRLFGEKELGDDEIWFTSRRRETFKIGVQDDQKQREELAIHELEGFLQQYCYGADVEDFDTQKVLEYVAKQRDSEKLPTGNLKELCKRLGLASGIGTPRRVAVLAFHRVPNRFIHSALVRAIAEAPGDGSYIRKEIEGSLSDQVENTLRWLISNLRTISVNAGAGQRIDRCELPEGALRELVVNAIVHRDYQANESVHIKITPKQVIITNPGKLNRAILDSDPPFTYNNSHPYNPGLLKVLIAQRWAEGHSLGFKIVLEEFAKYELPLPEIKNLPGGLVQVVIQRPDIIADTEIQELIWNIPYARNPLFTGREDLLRRLHTNLTGNKTAVLTQPQAISGLGGIGKTQTALEYAYRYRHDYHYVLWVNADTRDTIITSFLQLATLLKLPEREAQDQNDMIAAVQDWFSMHDGWLLIFDNADNLLIAEEFLPLAGRGHLLLTTRAHVSSTFAISLQVEQMDTQEAMLLLLRRARALRPDSMIDQASPTDQAAAKAIALELGGLPLALDQAGAYIEETQCSLTSYLNQYRKRQLALLRRRGGTSKQHPEPVAATWSLSFEQVEQLNHIAADLLRFLSFLAPDAIPEQLIIRGASELGPTLQSLANDESLLDEAIAGLARYSLVRRNREDSTITVHRLVQAVVKNSLDEQTQHQWAEYTVRAVNEAFPDVTDYRNWPYCQQLLPHAQNCADLIDQWQFTFYEAGRLYNDVGYYLYDRAQYSKAETFYRRAIAIEEQALGMEHPDTAQSLNNLSLLYYTQGKYDVAESLYLRALHIREQVYGPAHPDTAQSLNNLAELYRIQGKYEEAETLYRRTLAILEETVGPEHPTLAMSLNNLGLLYYAQDKFEEAKPLLERAIAIGEKTLGLSHPETAIRLNNLAGLYQQLGKYAEAEALFRRSLAIREQSLGHGHPGTATSLNNLATLYEAQGKYAEAEPLYKDALAIYEQVFGPTHYVTTKVRENYAQLLRSMKRNQ